MTDLKHLNKIIELILSKENLSNEEVRAIPRPFVDEQFLFALFDLLKAPKEVQTKIFLLLHIKAILSALAESGNDTLTELQYKVLKYDLIQILSDEEILCSIKELSFFTEMLIKSSYSNNNETIDSQNPSWNQIIQTLLKHLGSKDLITVKYALKTFPLVLFHLTPRNLSVENGTTPLGKTRDSNQSHESLKKTLQSFLQAFDSNKEQLNNLSGEILEALSLCCEVIGKEALKESGSLIIEKMLEIQTSLTQSKDALNSSIFSSWQRVCSVTQEDFVPFLDRINLSLTIFMENIYSSDDKTKISFVNMVGEFAKRLKEEHFPSVELYSGVLLKLLTNDDNQEVKKSVLTSLPLLLPEIKSIKAEMNKEFMIMISSQYMMSNLLCLEKVEDLDTTTSIFNSIATILSRVQSSFCFHEGIGMLLQSAFISIERFINSFTIANQEAQSNFFNAILRLIQTLFTIYKEMGTSPQLSVHIGEMILALRRLDNATVEFWIFQLKLLHISIEHSDPNPGILEVLQPFLELESSNIRALSCSIIALYCTKYKENMADKIESFLDFFFKSLKMEKGLEEDTNEYELNKEKITALIGKIIWEFFDSLTNKEILQIWINNLPLKLDKKAQITQCEILADIILKTENEILGENGENIVKISEALGGVVNPSEDLKKKLRKVIQVLTLKAKTLSGDNQKHAKDSIQKLENETFGYILRDPRPGDIGWAIHRQGVLYKEEYDWDYRFEALVAEIYGKFVQTHNPEFEKCWIAEKNGKVIGSITVVKHEEEVAKLRVFYVEPSERGRVLETA